MPLHLATIFFVLASWLTQIMLVDTAAPIPSDNSRYFNSLSIQLSDGANSGAPRDTRFDSSYTTTKIRYYFDKQASMRSVLPRLSIAWQLKAPLFLRLKSLLC